MTTEEIRELISVLMETGIAELEVQRGENRVRIRRAASSNELVLPPAAVSAAGGLAGLNPAAAIGPIAEPVDASAAASPSTAEAGTHVVKSPIVGTYYDAPSPGAPPFVKIGDLVAPHQTVCIIESMKLMNEIEAEMAGTLVKKLVENGRPVEYGEPLFVIKPD